MLSGCSRWVGRALLGPAKARIQTHGHVRFQHKSLLNQRTAARRRRAKGLGIGARGSPPGKAISHRLSPFCCRARCRAAFLPNTPALSQEPGTTPRSRNRCAGKGTAARELEIITSKGVSFCFGSSFQSRLGDLAQGGTFKSTPRAAVRPQNLKASLSRPGPRF